MPLFSKRREAQDDKAPETPTRAWYTNAPRHWPAVERKNVPADQPEVMHRLAFAAFAQKAFQESGSGCRFVGTSRTRLDPKGILHITIEVEDHGSRVPVFFYASPSPEAAAHYAGAVRFLEARGESRPVYYSSAALPEAAPGNPLRRFEWSDLAPSRGPPPAEGFAMWWSSPGEESAVGSPTLAAIRRAYQALDGIETYVFAAMKRRFRSAGDDARRLPLPADEDTFLLDGPEKRLLVLSVSQEKGFQFRFSVGDTPPAYRAAFWTVFAESAERWKRAVTGRNLPVEAPATTSPLGYWTAMEKALDCATQEGSPPAQIGMWLPAEA